VTPDIVVDVGNSRMKWGRCDAERVRGKVSLAHDTPVDWKDQALIWGASEQTRWVVAGVAPREVERFCGWLASRGTVPTVVTSDLFEAANETGLVTEVESLQQIGVDRLLSSLAAFRRQTVPSPVVVINVGTAMTVDFVKADGVHVGGVILPGPQLMSQSLHNHTAKLPAIKIEPKLPSTFLGRNTEQAIQVGIANAVLSVAYQLVWDWVNHVGRPPWVYATGGDVGYFEGFEFSANVAGFTIDPFLTLEGIRLAAEAMG
jgi:type III pantothenate kinase